MRPFIDLSVYLVLDPGLCGGYEGMLETTRAAVAGGVTCVQLRAPQWKKRELVECGRALKAILAPSRVPLIVNDHADVCVAVDADGLHVGQQDLRPEDARAIIGPERVLGLSVSYLSELSAIDTGIVDHIGAGPVFATATKKDAEPPMGLDGLRRVCEAKPCPVVAIGSVKAANAADIIAAGADGLAVVSAICGQTDPEAAARTLSDIVMRTRAQL